MSEESIRNLVSVGTVGLTAGIDLPNTVIVQGGADGAFFPANQIGWGTSYFGGQTFTTTTELLSLIDAAIAAGGSDVVKVLEDYVNGLLDKYVKDEELTALDYATKAFVGDANETVKTWVGDQNYLQGDDIAHLASTSALEAHTDNVDIHVTAQQKTDWQAAADAIKAFLDDNATSDQVVNTLKELQEYISSHGEVATGLLNDVTALKASASTYATKGELEPLASKSSVEASVSSLQSSISAIANDYVTSQELQDAIDDVDVSEQLKNYASASSVSALQGQYTALSSTVTQIDGKVETANANWQAADTAINASISALNTNVTTNINDIAALKASASTYATKSELEASESSAAATYASKSALEASESSAAATYATKAELEASESSAAATYATKAEIEPLASKSALEAHTGNDGIHVTANDKTNWDAAASAINTFLNDADTTESAIDTLKEIAAWIAADETGTAALVGRVAALEAADETFATKAELTASESSAAATYASKSALDASESSAAATYATKASLSASESSAAATYATKNEIASLVSVSSGANSMTIAGERYTFSVVNNVLSVSKYVETKYNNFTIGGVSVKSKTHSAKVNDTAVSANSEAWLGSTYSLAATIELNDNYNDNIAFTVSTTNSTGNQWRAAIYNTTTSSYILGNDKTITNDAETEGQMEWVNGTSYTVNANLGDVTITNASKSGTVTAWSNLSIQAKTTGHNSFHVWIKEKGRNYANASDTKLSGGKITTTTQSSVTESSITITPKAQLLQGVSGDETGTFTSFKTITTGTTAITKTTGQKVTFGVGVIPTIAIPKAIGSDKYTGLSVYDAEGSFQDTSWEKIKTASIAVEGIPTIEYDIYSNKSTTVGSATVRIAMK